jgi:CRISPR-associated protein Csd1
MILQALDAYYRRKQADADPAKRLPVEGLEDKKIPFILEIDANGTLLDITDTRSIEGKKSIGRRFLVPQGVKSLI